MLLLQSVLPLLLAAEAALATPLKGRSPYAVKDTHFVPQRWTRVDAAPRDHIISLQIGLKQSQFDELERHLYEVSDPDHERYGKHLTAEQVNDLIQPTEESLTLVLEWLFEHDIKLHQLGYSPARDWISVSLPVEKVEHLLDTKYSVYEHEDGDRLVRTPEWSLPKNLHEHVSLIQPTNAFYRTAPLRTNLKVTPDWKGPGGHGGHHGYPMPKPYLPKDPTVATACNTSLVTTLCLRVFYGTYDYKPQVPGLNRIGLNDFLGESNNRSDTKLFLEQYRPDVAAEAYEFKVVIIDNGNNEQTHENKTELEDGKDLEGNLDIETIIGITAPSAVTAFTTGGSAPFKADDNTPTDTNEPYLVWVQYALTYPNIPQVISTSYGDDEQTVPESYAKTVCNLFAQLGARGVSLLFASGDSGVGSDGYCFSNDGKNTTTFLPSFPPTCPYVTAVGATKNFDPEVAALDLGNEFASGGGFSNYFPRPSYQDAAVTSYLHKIGDEYAGRYNPAGRAYPDIAAQGSSFATVWDGRLVTLDGTSASTPLASSILSLVNDALLASGRPVLGFLNPWLYKRGYKGFSDITSGSSAGCGVEGFPAEVGWDAVTGWGTPHFRNVLAAVKQR